MTFDFTLGIRGVTLLLAPVLLAGCSNLGAPEIPSRPTTFSFGAWGDLPYARSDDEPKMPALIADMNASDIAFSIFDGDIKDSSVPCDDTVYDAAIARFDSLKRPAIYVPGDNEWTDCWKAKAGAYDPLERLAHLRRVMFAKAESFGREKMNLEQQGPPGGLYAENTRFVHGGIVFVELNIAGSNNNRVETDADCLGKPTRDLAQCAADNAEFAARDAADIAWMQQGFALARIRRAPGIVLTFQGDPHFDVPGADAGTLNTAGNLGYPNFVANLVAAAKDFPGQVLLIHGDSHYFRLDKPFMAEGHLLANVTRLETFGSPNAHWVKVIVDPASRDVFAIRPMVVKRN